MFFFASLLKISHIESLFNWLLKCQYSISTKKQTSEIIDSVNCKKLSEKHDVKNCSQEMSPKAYKDEKLEYLCMCIASGHMGKKSLMVMECEDEVRIENQVTSK